MLEIKKKKRKIGNIEETVLLEIYRFKCMTLQLGLQIITIHVLPNICQGNQTTKFGQWVEYNKRNIFLQKLCRKWGKETSSRFILFPEKALY